LRPPSPRVDLDNPATVRGRTSSTVVVPRIVGPSHRLRPVEVRDVEFLRANTDRVIKITPPGPFTMSRARPRTSSTEMRKSWSWTTQRRSTRRCAISIVCVPDSIRLQCGGWVRIGAPADFNTAMQ
jgi:hypothetical protein